MQLPPVPGRFLLLQRHNSIRSMLSSLLSVPLLCCRLSSCPCFLLLPLLAISCSLEAVPPPSMQRGTSRAGVISSPAYLPPFLRAKMHKGKTNKWHATAFSPPEIALPILHTKPRSISLLNFIFWKQRSSSFFKMLIFYLYSLWRTFQWNCLSTKLDSTLQKFLLKLDNMDQISYYQWFFLIAFES